MSLSIVCLQIELLQFNLLPPFSDSASSELEVARSVYEAACLLSIAQEDLSGFGRHMSQLQPYYFDFSSLLTESKLQNELLGLSLMHHLVSNDPSSFHAELERIPAEQRNSDLIRYPVQLDQHLMEGSYNKIFAAKTNVPSKRFSFFLEILSNTVRERIAECTSVAYDTLSVADAKTILMLNSEAELTALAEKYEWTVSRGIVNFPSEDPQKGMKPNAHELVQRNLQYATELERIV
jgi:26S proteasome regulatory subunit N12